MKIRTKLALMAMLAVVFVAIPGAFFAYRIASEYLIAETHKRVASRVRSLVSEFQNHLVYADKTLYAVQQALEQALTAPSHAEDLAQFDAWFELHADGTYRSRRSTFDGTREAGAFIPPTAPLNDGRKRFYVRAKRTLDVFGARGDPVFQNVWVLTHDRGEVIFDAQVPDFVFRARADQDYTQTPWVTLTAPASNPQRAVRWTPASFDPVMDAWMLSAVFPLYVDDRWMGSIGYDLPLTQLTRLLTRSDVEQYRGVETFLIDSNGEFVLAGSWQSDLLRNLHGQPAGAAPLDFSGEPQLDSLLRWQSVYDADSGNARIITLRGERYLSVSANMKLLNWKLVQLIPLAEVLVPAHRFFALIGSIMLLILLASGVVVLVVANSMLVQPLLRIAGVARAYGQGETARRLRLQGADEIAQVAASFDSMADSLERGQRELRWREARYRTMVNSVREVIFQMDTDGRCLFLSKAWELLTGYRVIDVLGHSIYEFIAAEDVEGVRRNMETLVGAAGVCRCEFCMQTANGERIEVELTAQPTTTAEGETVLTGTINDISTLYYGREVGELLRRAEKLLAAGHVTEELLQFFADNSASLFNYPLVIAALDSEGRMSVVARSDSRSHLLRTLSGRDEPETEIYAQAFAERRSRLVSGRDGSFAAWRAAAARAGIGSMLAIPLRIGKDRCAILAFHSRDEAGFPQDRQARLEDYCRRIAELLRRAEDMHWLRLQRTALESAASGIMIADVSHEVIWVNPAMESLTGYTRNELIGSTPKVFSPALMPGARYSEFTRTLNTARTWSGEVTNQRKDGSVYTVHETVTALTDPSGKITHYVSVQSDITAIKNAEARLEHMATHDALTGLCNRVLFRERLKDSLSLAARSGKSVGVMLLDLDRFKAVNDTLGHMVADELLKAVAARLQGCLREHDTVARLGGDEFTVLLPELDTLDHAAVVAGKIQSALAEPLDLAGQQLSITTSMGISLYPDDSLDLDELMQRADAAMYQAKASGRNNYKFYTRELHERSMQRINLERELRRAIEQNEFVLHYQPIADTRSGTIIGAEALLRWQHPERGLLAPSVFITVAEDSGLIVPIGDWVLRAACAEGAAWEMEGLRDIELAINLSTRQFRRVDLVERVAHACAQAGFSSRNVLLELTESLMMEDMEQGISTMRALKNLGVSISVDDFGVGYSSLAYLKRFPLDTLKIDRSFMESVPQNSEATAIVSTILAMARTLGLGVVAEGVETEEQLEFLRALNCPRYQGYLLGRAMPADEFAALARRTRVRQPMLISSAVPPATDFPRKIR